MTRLEMIVKFVAAMMSNPALSIPENSLEGILIVAEETADEIIKREKTRFSALAASGAFKTPSPTLGRRGEEC